MLIAKHITIGPFVPEDCAPLFCWANDVAAARLDFSYRPVDMMAHQQWWNSLGKDPSRVVFAIRRITEPSIIGYVQISNISSVHRSAELGIRIGAEKDRGQGFGTEALALAVAFCWNHLNLNRLQLFVFSHNRRAVEAYQAAGFKKEGLLRKAAYIDGAWVDVTLMALLRPAQKRRRAPRPASLLQTPAMPAVASEIRAAPPPATASSFPDHSR